MSDRIAVMSSGVGRAGGHARERLRASPNHVRRRLHRRLQPDAGHGDLGRAAAAARSAWTAAPSSRPRWTGSAAGERCHAVVRPEKLVIRHASEPAGRRLPSVEGSSRARSTSAPRRRSSCRLAADVSMTVLVPNADEAERARLPGGGAAVRLSWAPEHMHVVRESDAGRAAIQPSRRRRAMMLTKLAIAIAALAAALGIAACGGDDGVGGGGDGEVPVAEGGKASGDVLISNWPGYVDPGEDGTIAQFEEETGVKVEYKEDVSDNVIFFNKLKPQLDQGKLRRPQPLRRHRLDGEADVRPRLPAGAQPRRPADRVRQHPPAVRGVDVPTPSASSRSRGRVVRPGSSSTPTRPPRSTRSTTCSTRSTRAR